MKIDPITRLKDYIKSPSSPTWSSQGLIDMFNNLDGTMLDKQQIVLPIIDEKFSSVEIMTEYQFNFIRDVTLHAKYTKSRVEFTKEDLKWLLDKFDDHPTQQRAIMIYILLDEQYLSAQEQNKITNLLKGTFAESYIHFENNK